MIAINIKIDKQIFNEWLIPHLFNYNYRFEVHKGSAASGKSYGIMQKIVLKALRSKRKVLVMRKVGNTIKDSTFQMCIDILQQFQIYDKCKVNKSDFTIELFNGSIFLFKGLDDSERIKSIAGITDVVCEEATEFTVDDITQLNLRLRAKTENNQMYFMFNPVSKDNWVYSYFGFDKALENETMPIRKEKDTIIFCTTYKDNKFLPDEYIATLEAMAETNPYYYSVYVQGLFASLDKLVFPRFEIEEFNYRDLLKQKNTTAIFGLDFGYVNDPSAFICSVVDEENKKLYIFDEMYQKGLLNNEIADWIKHKGYAKEVIVSDCAEQKSIEEIRRCGINRIRKCWKGKGSIKTGIDKINQYQIIVHPLCVNTITELRNYSYKRNKVTGEYMNEPIDKYNHLMDALRYSIQTVTGKGKVKVINKSLFGL